MVPVKATLIFQRKFTLTCENGRIVSVFMDLYHLPEGHPRAFPEGYRFSWIAFDSVNESAQVLFDCHAPNGPHFHVDSDSNGKPFEWSSLEHAHELFFQKVRVRFCEF